MSREYKKGDAVRVVVRPGHSLVDGTYHVTKDKKYIIVEAPEASGSIKITLDNGGQWWVSKKAVVHWITPIFVAEKEV